jgi:hypothetical protein
MRAASSSLTASPCRIGALGQCATGPAGECPDHPVPDAAKAHVATGGHRSDRWQLAHGDDGRAGLISGGQAGPKRMLRRWPASGRFHLESGEAQVMCGCGRAGERRPDSSSGRRGPGQPARSGDRGPRRTLAWCRPAACRTALVSTGGSASARATTVARTPCARAAAWWQSPPRLTRACRPPSQARIGASALRR